MRSVSGFLDCRRGNIALLFAVALPALLVGGAVGLDAFRFANARAEAQDAADAAALAGAREFFIAASSSAAARSRAEAVAKAEISRFPSVFGAEVLVTADAKAGLVSVGIAQPLRSLFPAGDGGKGRSIQANATARIVGSSSVCVVALHETDGHAVRLDNSARLISRDCAVYSNSSDPHGLVSQGGALLEAGLVCSAGGYDGEARNFSPLPLNDCPRRADPLAGRLEPTVGSCDHVDLVLKDFDGVINPGVYCGGLVIDGTSNIKANAGEYVIKDGVFEVKAQSILRGERTGFFFSGDTARLKFEGESDIALSAPEAGVMAGVLFWQSAAASEGMQFEIYSNYVDELVGTIYLPNATLHVEATQEVAEDSAYTAIVARKISIVKNSTLVLNRDYGATTVPGISALRDPVGEIVLAR